MNIISFKCPECNANIDAKPNDQGFMFCNYCGRKILLNNDEVLKSQIEIEKIKLEHDIEKDNKRSENIQSILTAIIVSLFYFITLLMCYLSFK